ncbi:hypothetical protein [Streptomyces sp. NBC_00306]|uniref:hypothetical protein n=1 Tax=Streptomyces sp. NBC_00306 TaxID=2975708 RepID=UPI002E29F61B|nr:hypothetical protein [Streptomyces sp. NBC_00306]
MVGANAVGGLDSAIAGIRHQIWSSPSVGRLSTPAPPRRADGSEHHRHGQDEKPADGKDVLLPAGTIPRLAPETETVHIDLTKEQIKNAPQFDKDKHPTDPRYREQLAGYYLGNHT